MITCCVLIDEMLPTATKGQRLRAREPMRTLAVSLVIPMEIVGTPWGSAKIRKCLTPPAATTCSSFRQWSVDRMTFVRQAVNLWVVKERRWCLIRDSLLLYGLTVALVETMPISVCQVARAYRSAKPVCSRSRVGVLWWNGCALARDRLGTTDGSLWGQARLGA